MAFAIMRCKKIKTNNAMKFFDKHCRREIDVPNADPDRKKYNLEIYNKGQDCVDMFNERTKNIKIRKNAVRAIEVMMTFTHEATNQLDLNEWVGANLDWLNKIFGDDNIAKVYLHRDETTIHLHGFVIPIDEKNKLNARHYIGGSSHRMSELQTDYAKDMERFGLERGVQGSKSKHEDIGKFYANLNNALDVKLPDPTTSKDFLRVVPETAEHYRERITPVMQSVQAENLKLRQQVKTLKGQHYGLSLQERLQLEGQITQLERALAERDLKQRSKGQDYTH